MINKVIEIAKKAGEEILKVYDEDFSVVSKDDNSPLTKADLLADEIIKSSLAKSFEFPIVTEESYVEYEVRKNWQKFWLVDPLDGTKDFIAKNGGFTVNIALIEQNKPILGVVYVPVSGDIYSATLGGGAFKNGKKIYNNSKRKNLIATDSNFHSTKAVLEFFEKYGITNIQKFGSSIKICKLAEGIVDVYPRLNGTKEWDTAASHIIANEAGCKLIDIVTNKELTYNKKSIKNNFFIASRDDLEFSL